MNEANKSGYKKTKLGWIPEEWAVTTLNSLGSFSKGRNISKADVLDSGLPCVLYGDLYTKHHNHIRFFSNFIDETTAENSYELSYGDILFAGSGETAKEIGKCAVYMDEEPAYAGGDIIIFRSYKSDSEFLGYLLNDEVVNRQKYRLAQGYSVVHIYASHLKKLYIPLPPLPEQKKIAEILSTWDRAIETLEQLIAKKEELKKGLMQQLLSGKTRFSGFEGEWEEVRLGSLGYTYTGLSGKSKDDFGAGKPYIPYMNVFRNSTIDPDFLDFVAIGEDENQQTVKYGDIFFTVSSETPDEVGMAAVLLEDIGETYLNSFCFGFRLNDFSTLLPEFAAYYFRSGLIRKEIYKLAQGSTRFNLTKRYVMEILINLPPIEEQIKIAKVIDDLNKQIKKLTSQKVLLVGQKKGLMQQLLTGKKRVHLEET